MRIGVCCGTILLITAQVLFADISKAQDIRETRIEFACKHVSLKTALQKLQAKSGYNFFYMSSKVSAYTDISLEEETRTIQTTLELILMNTPFGFKQEGKNIILSEKSPEQVPKQQQPSSLPPPVKGKVTDQKGQALPGVSIIVKETQLGTITDTEGNFSLTLPEGSTVLVFSFIGYVSQEVPVNGRSEIDIILAESVDNLKEIVVVGYGTQSKRNLTSSISSVSPKDIANQPVQQVGQALQGKIAGVQIIQNSGSPGSSLMVRIRGAGTVNNSEPLYVIDGNLGASPSSLDPNQIESIEILKSASASAIYGAQGANGVIIITTKKGVTGKSNIQLNVYSGVQQVHRTMPLVNGRQYAQLYNLALTNAGKDPLFKDVQSLGAGTDWQDAIFRSASILNAEISASGGSEKGTYYISGGYYNQKGTVINTDYSRINFRVNSEYKVTKAITIGENISLSYGTRNSIPEFGARNPVPNAWHMDPTVPVKNPDGSWGFPKFSDTKNPVAEATLYTNTIKSPILNGSAYLTADLLSSLKFRSQINMNLGFSNLYNFIPTFDIFPLQRNLVTSLTREMSQTTNWDWQNTLTYEKSFGQHDLEVLGGITAQSNRTENMVAIGQNLPINANTDESLRYLSLATTGQQVSGGAGEYGMLSFLGRVNYSYKGTYLFTGNLRVDGSSKFGKNNRFGTFPSFSLGWRISDEEFMKNVSFINDLKIRGGWGMLGNQNSLPNYAFASTVTPNIIYGFGNSISQGQAATSIGNPSLKWESTKETEIGIDFTGFGNRITVSAAYYNKSTSNMLLRVPIPAYSGVTTPPFVNGGDVNNQGVELLITYRKKAPGKFTYDVSANLSNNINKVTKLSNSQAAIFEGSFSRTTVGEPIGSFYGHVMDGIFQTQGEVDQHAYQTSGTSPGDIRFKDLNGDNIIDQNDRTTIGSPWPKLSYGISSNLRYGPLDMNLGFYGVYGNDIIANWKYFTQGSNFYNFDTEMLNAWSGPGTSNTIPRLNVNDPNNNLRASSYYIENGSYLRLKSIQLGYTYPHPLLKSIQKVRIYVACQNLLTFTKYRGYDPEIGSPGSTLIVGTDEGYYPQPRIVTAGLSLSF
ncbi:TonB-dependent receptor [Dyadobacter sp. CY323]|uniref:SusC/RagA family TonB-linked outer membrane protein n=1 Tax=Dyadobacter sp. CY323 TaxID=2907302 RepID=UPI001F2028AE|nr:TonB-dependent receptor [Dyadobacter sp. CY323]MCE6992466.1 TonB-dependent receptor [Dyadobacter sp. CY323]